MRCRGPDAAVPRARRRACAQRHEAERRFYRKDGTLIWTNMTASIVRDAGRQPAFCIAAIENVSERKRAEEALRQSNQRLSGWVTELEERNREISLLSEMGDMLQACRSIDEAHAVIARMARQLFVSGQRLRLRHRPGNSNLVEAVAVWGIAGGRALLRARRVLGAAARPRAPRAGPAAGPHLQAHAPSAPSRRTCACR